MSPSVDWVGVIWLTVDLGLTRLLGRSDRLSIPAWLASGFGSPASFADTPRYRRNPAIPLYEAPVRHETHQMIGSLSSSPTDVCLGNTADLQDQLRRNIQTLDLMHGADPRPGERRRGKCDAVLVQHHATNARTTTGGEANPA
jgi:hypothetical protein